MFKRFDNTQLLLALGALALLYVGAMAFGGKADRTFRKMLVVIDTTQLSKIVIQSPKADPPVELIRSGPSWQVTGADGQFPTAAGAVPNALNSLNYLEATQLVSRDEADQAEFQVDETGTRVQVYEGEKQVADLILGKFAYKQSGMASYVRETEEDEIYAVSGYLDAAFNKGADDWRDKTLLKGTPAEWSALNFRYPADSSFQLVKGLDNTWSFSDTSIAVNSSEISSYLNGLNLTNGTNFVVRPATSTPEKELTLQLVAGGAVAVKAYRDPTHTWVLSSSLNPTAYFADPEGNLVKKIFVEPGRFLPDS